MRVCSREDHLATQHHPSWSSKRSTLLLVKAEGVFAAQTPEERQHVPRSCWECEANLYNPTSLTRFPDLRQYCSLFYIEFNCPIKEACISAVKMACAGTEVPEMV